MQKQASLPLALSMFKLLIRMPKDVAYGSRIKWFCIFINRLQNRVSILSHEKSKRDEEV